VSATPAAKPPAASVIIPTKNRSAELERTVRGALAQQGVEVELIVVDDASSVDVAEALRDARDPRLTIIRQTASRGVAAARNAGVAAARFEWLAFLDDDDLWAPDKLSTQINAAQAAGATFAYASVVVVDEQLRMIDFLEAPPSAQILATLLPGNYMPAGASNVVARADAVRSLGGFDESLHQLTGWDLWIRLAREGSAVACDAPLAAYVQHRGAMLLTERKQQLIREFEYLRSKHAALCSELGVEGFDRAGLEAWMAWGESRAGRRFRAAAGFLRAATMYRGEIRRWMLRRVVHALRGQLITDSGRPPADDRERPAWLDAYA
jgi:hypothetical protein